MLGIVFLPIYNNTGALKIQFERFFRATPGMLTSGTYITIIVLAKSIVRYFDCVQDTLKTHNM